MVMKKLLRKFVDISNPNTEVKNKLLQFELQIEHQQRQIDELRELLLALSSQINYLQTELNYQIDKIGKGL